MPASDGGYRGETQEPAGEEEEDYEKDGAFSPSGVYGFRQTSRRVQEDWK
jgi:hypothetical protein